MEYTILLMNHMSEKGRNYKINIKRRNFTLVSWGTTKSQIQTTLQVIYLTIVKASPKSHWGVRNATNAEFTAGVCLERSRIGTFQEWKGFYGGSLYGLPGEGTGSSWNITPFLKHALVIQIKCWKWRRPLIHKIRHWSNTKLIIGKLAVIFRLQ